VIVRIAPRQEVVPAKALVGPDETEHVGRQRVERSVLALHHVAVEVRRTSHRLAGVVDDEVEPVARGENVLRERFDARRVTQIEAEDLQSVAPLAEVGFGRIAGGGVAGKAGRDDQRCTATQQLDPCLIADLHPAAGEQRDRSRQVGELAALGEVVLGARGAQLVVEVVDLAVLDLADVTVLLVDGLAVRRIVDVALLEAVGWVDVRRGEHRLLAQRSDAGPGEHVLVAADSRRSAPTLQRLGADPALLGIWTEHVAGSVQQVLLLLRCQDGEEFPIGSDPPEELGGIEQVGSQSLAIAAAAVSVQGVRPASDRRS
jgi:hypothetical protein